MPPWHAAEPHGTFTNDRRLSDAEKNTLIAWVDAGATQGDPKDLPPAPKFAEGWQIGKPDVVLSIPKPFDVAGSGAIAYQFFTVPTNFTEDKCIQALEIRPGERSVVHHILVFVKAPGAPRPRGGVRVRASKNAPNAESFGRARGVPRRQCVYSNRDHGARHIDHDL